MQLTRLLRTRTAHVPLLMSLLALVLLGGYVAVYGVARPSAGERDEGFAAHLFQLLLAGQLPIIAWFAVVWLRRAPLQALLVLALQAGAVVVALLTVALLEG